MIGLVVKNEAKSICKDKIWFLMFALSLLWYVDPFLYLMLLADFKSIKTSLIKKSM